jgi:hypothetical protein
MMLEIEDVRRLVVHPGEMLVVRVPVGTSVERARHISDSVQANVPDGVRVLIAMGDVDFEVVSGDLA